MTLQFKQKFDITFFLHVSETTSLTTIFIAGSFGVSLIIDLVCLYDVGTGWWGALGTFMISRPI